MLSNRLARDIERGKTLLTSIVRLTSDFLSRFDNLCPAEIQEFEQRRRFLLDELLQFDKEMKQQLFPKKMDLPMPMLRQIEDFRIFQEVFLQIIMKNNAAIIAKAKESQNRIRLEMDEVTRGKQAIKGYNEISHAPFQGVDQAA
jgi:hypothetical protein